ncbi:MAG TPA: AAA family ATPase, partial [Chloroflexota bacterium]|nr:AAA family ATPase [Chloroflexota bacterium]
MIKLHSLRATKFKQLDDVALQFPSRGSVLIQGLNEAGKSTLFESLFFGLFGKALVTEEPNRLEDLINYQSPRALVQLTFSTDGASFSVSRALNRGKSNAAVLEIEYAGGKRETVTSLTHVNRRIVDELGLDGEAVLNSCFVEQKKLEKLESMTAQQRRDTLLRLLNLDRLTTLEAQYKPSSDDDYQLQQLRDRLKLAEIQRELPPALERLRGVEAELLLLTGTRLQRELAQLADFTAAEQHKQAALQIAHGRLSQDLAEVERLKAIRDLASSAGKTLLAIEDDRAESERLQLELAQLQLEAARLPELEADLSRLEALAIDVAELDLLDQAQAQRQRQLQTLAEAAERLQRLQASAAERQEALASVESELTAAQAEVEHAETLDRQSRRAELLRGWLQVREVALIAQESERELGHLRQELFEVEQQVAEGEADRRLKRRTAFGMGFAACLVLALAAGLLGT